MAQLWIVQLSAENGERAFNVIVHEDARATAEMIAETAVATDGWTDVRVLRSGHVAADRLPERDPVFQNAAVSALELGWSIIRYIPTNPN